MRRTFLRSCIITAGVLVLPGCLAINALLGAAGLIVGGPVQYAATAYTVGEYTYHYAVNDKTPDEVIEEKFAWLTGPDEEIIVAEARTVPTTVMVKSVTLKDTPSPATGLHLAEVRLDTPDTPPAEATPPSAKLRPVPTATPPIVRVASAVQARKPATRKFAPAAPAIVQVQARNVPQHTYVEHKTDPLLERLSRMEQGLAMAERLMNRETESGVRVSLANENAGQAGSVNGSWSIRHPVMQISPAPAAPLVEAPGDLDQMSS